MCACVWDRHIPLPQGLPGRTGWAQQSWGPAVRGFAEVAVTGDTSLDTVLQTLHMGKAEPSPERES